MKNNKKLIKWVINTTEIPKYYFHYNIEICYLIR